MSKSIITRMGATALVAGAAALAGLSAGGLVSNASAAELPQGVQALIAGAKKESQLVIFGRTLKPTAVRGFTKRVSAFYGFPIKLKMGGGLHTTKAAEVALAVKKGVPTGFDVFWTSYNTSVRLERSGALRKFDWVKELGVPPATRASEYGVKSHDVSLAFVTYNTNLVKDADAPRVWDDLLDAKWKEEAYRKNHVDHIIDVLQGWTKNHSVDKLFEMGQLMHFPWAPVHSPQDVLDSPQLKARGFFDNMGHGELNTQLPCPGLPYKLLTSKSSPTITKMENPEAARATQKQSLPC